MESLGRGLESLIPDRGPEEIPADLGAENSEDKITPESEHNLTARAGTPASPLASLGASQRATFHDNFQPKKTDSVFWIEIDKIESNPYQPRREFNEGALKDLAMSIREHGLLQPILVSKQEIETQTGLDVRYQLIAGERRWRAATLAGLSQIPAVIRRGVPDNRLKLELALIENVQREDLNPMERARAFKQLVDEFHLMQKEIAERIGKSRETVANTLRLLTLPADIQQGLHEGRITEGHARAVLIAGDDQTKQFEVYNAILMDRLNVREAENRARHVSGKAFTPRKRPSAVQDPELRRWQNELQERLGTKVRLEKLGDRGKIIVEFYSDEELQGLLGKLIHET
ncbi:MAG: ParB/RepB/Spo0J family partition protein [Candidatus Sungbacteria bacterium]|nr:ParB/RepB/Spo0J family partition protein [Candidatus Sungbacteria bacterium]